MLNGFAGSTANAVFFYFYQDGKKRYKVENRDPTSLEIMAVSFRASVISMVTTTPMWTTRTRLVLY